MASEQEFKKLKRFMYEKKNQERNSLDQNEKHLKHTSH